MSGSAGEGRIPAGPPAKTPRATAGCVGGAYLPSHCPTNGVHAQASGLQPTRTPASEKAAEPGGPGPHMPHTQGGGEGEGVNRR